MVDVAVTQEPADLQELLYAKSKPVLANMLAPELKTGVAKNYKVIDVERARGFSLVTVQLTRDPEKDIATATPEEIRTQVIEYEHHNLQDVLEHFLGKGEITVAKAITKLDDVNELIIERTDKILLDAADINFQDNGNNNISLFVKDLKDLRWWGAAHLSFNLVEGGTPEVPGKPLVKNVKYNPEIRTVTADVTNATEVEITTSTGLSFRSQTNMDKVTYQFDEDLPAGTTITVTAGTSKGTVEVPGVLQLAFSRDTGKVIGLITGTTEKEVTIGTSYGEVVNASAAGDNSFVATLANYTLDAFVINALVAGVTTKLSVDEIPTTLTDLVYEPVANTITGKSNRPHVKIVTTTGINTNVDVHNGSFSYAFPTQIAAGTVITVSAGGISKDAIATALPFVPELKDVAFDNVVNAVSGKANTETVYVSTTTGEGLTVNVVGGEFQHMFIELLPAGTVVTVRADSAVSEVTVAAYLDNVDYSSKDNVVFGQTNQLVITVTTTSGYANDIVSNNGNFDHEFPVRLLKDDVITVTAGTEVVKITVPEYVPGNPITDLVYDAITNSVSGKTAAEAVSIEVNATVITPTVPVLDGEFTYTFTESLNNGSQIVVKEANGEWAETYVSGVATISGITYDHRSNQILADLSGTDKITITGNFTTAELTAVNGKVGHIPDVVLQGNTVVKFVQGDRVVAEYTVKPLTNVMGDITNIDGTEITLGNGTGDVQLYVNLDKLRYSYTTLSWEVTGPSGVSIDADGLLKVLGLASEAQIVIKSTADGHVTTSSTLLKIGALD